MPAKTVWRRREVLGLITGGVATQALPGQPGRSGGLSGVVRLPAEASPPMITTERELFVDDLRISEIKGVIRQLHPFVKHPDNPIVVADRPWEGTAVHLYGSVIRDGAEGIWKMWYRAGTQAAKDYDARTNVCYAVSQDGLRWKKPALGVHDHYGVHKTNIVFKPHNALGVGKARFDSVAVLKDPYDADSTKRYKMVTFQYNDEDYYAVDKPRPSGCYAAFSPD